MDGLILFLMVASVVVAYVIYDVRQDDKKKNINDENADYL